MESMKRIICHLFIAVTVASSMSVAVGETAGSYTSPSFVAGELREGRMAVLDQVRELPLESADDVLRDVIQRLQESHPQEAQAAAHTLGKLPGAPALYERRLAELPHLRENTSLRIVWINALSHLRERWALNLLARYLFDDRPMESQYSGNELTAVISQMGGAVTNRSLAASAMGSMGIINFPIKKRPILYTEKDDDQLRKWWRENEHQPDEFFFGKGAEIEVQKK